MNDPDELVAVVVVTSGEMYPLSTSDLITLGVFDDR